MLSSVEASDIFSAIIKYSINLEKTFVPPFENRHSCEGRNLIWSGLSIRWQHSHPFCHGACRTTDIWMMS